VKSASHLLPDSAIQLQKLGYDCLVETGSGMVAGFSDDQYKAAGVEISTNAEELAKTSDVIVKVLPPSETEVKRFSSSKILISFFYPGTNEALLEIAKLKIETHYSLRRIQECSMEMQKNLSTSSCP